MSRIGKLPVKLPAGVDVKIDGRNISVKGPKGQLEWRLPRGVEVEQAQDSLKVKLINSQHPQLWGLARTLIDNMVTGVSQGYSKQLEIQGVGYKAQASGSTLVLNVGFSHPVEYQLPEGVEAKVEASIITVSGIDKQLVGQTAAEIRDFRRPEPYKGKGIRYVGEHVRRKAGKTAGKAE